MKLKLTMILMVLAGTSARRVHSGPAVGDAGRPYLLQTRRQSGSSSTARGPAYAAGGTARRRDISRSRSSTARGPADAAGCHVDGDLEWSLPGGTSRLETLRCELERLRGQSHS